MAAEIFNNLPTVINGYADLVLKQIERESPGRRGIEEIRKAGRQAGGSVILTALGYIVLEAAHPAAALLIASNHPARIDLMVSDVVMPGLGGPELARRLAPIHPETAVLYISGHAERDIAERTMFDPAKDFLHKPFTPDEPGRKVKEMISRTRES